jgi:hypothetical protein
VGNRARSTGLRVYVASGVLRQCPAIITSQRPRFAGMFHCAVSNSLGVFIAQTTDSDRLSIKFRTYDATDGYHLKRPRGIPSLSSKGPVSRLCIGLSCVRVFIKVVFLCSFDVPASFVQLRSSYGEGLRLFAIKTVHSYLYRIDTFPSTFKRAKKPSSHFLKTLSSNSRPIVCPVISYITSPLSSSLVARSVTREIVLGLTRTQPRTFVSTA